MASIKTAKVEKSLLKKGFVQSDTHHHYFEFHHEGVLMSRTYTSHSGKDIDDYLITQMAKQCLMKRPFFIEFVECTKSKEDYLTTLQ
ncbi:hypothetical protein [Dyadobacter sp. CY323]|uniref:hypothetical protein n=1 Tax=Dyadobacter sp. CY323 TaxID=2907302 RepID=UPI001F416FC7|nr:hypothetical protein [Dyadobacter sp. CY323]MCE6991920.1 hypothetical protein [Dyadobacter sp. CY323]